VPENFVGNFVGPLLVPLLTTILGAIGVLVQDWFSRRSRVGRRKVAMEDAGAQIKFAIDWWSARQSIQQSPEDQKAAQNRASQWLDEASALVTDTKLELSRPDDGLTARRLALLYPFLSTPGRVVRAASWISFGFTVTILGTSISQKLYGDMRGWASYQLAVGTLFAALGLILRFLAVAVENVASSTPVGDRRQGFVRRLLLLYRFRRWSARWVRLLFYAGLAGLAFYVGLCITRTLELWTLVWVPANAAGTAVFCLAVTGIRAWAVSLDAAADPRLPAEATPGTPGIAPAGSATPIQLDSRQQTPAGTSS
jgi:hypothetical protein